MDFQDNDNNKEEMTDIFQAETEDILDRIFESLSLLKSQSQNKDLIFSIYRELHSLKGAVRMAGYNKIQALIHKIEDVFDACISDNLLFDSEKTDVVTESIELVSKYIQDSIANGHEFTDSEYEQMITSIEYICSKEYKPSKKSSNSFTKINNKSEETLLSPNLRDSQEVINRKFNQCFELIDGIVPEEESQETIILRETIQELYNLLENYDLYEVKTHIENSLTKLDFAINSTNIFTISEILDLRNELSSAAAKFNTSIIDDSPTESTFFDAAEKVNLMQNNFSHGTELKEEIIKLRKQIRDSQIVEIIDIIIEIVNFIVDNSVQIEEQMCQTLKSALEYCAIPNEDIDEDLIIQQLEIMKQLLELNYKKNSGLTEIKNLSTQTSMSGKSATEIKTLHVNAQKLDLLVNMVGELIITKIKTEKNLEKIEDIKNANENCHKDLLKTSNYLRHFNRKYIQSGNNEQYTMTFTKQALSMLSELSQNMSKIISDLNTLYRSSKEDDIKMHLIIDEMESMVKSIRVLPISTVFNSFSRMVRDIATEKGKEIDFQIECHDTCADKKIIEEIKTPLIHILRNSIDHGIESKEERIAAGKNPVGKILLSATQDENKVIIEVSDDGQGFNIQKIKNRAVSRGFLTQDDISSMSDEAIMNIIFWPGFTTGDSITSISGRGIGLDVVKTKISQLNGKVKVLSDFGRGCCIRIEIPVTMATLRVFLVRVSNQIFAIPIQMITTFVLKPKDAIKSSNGSLSIIHNEKILPLYYLSDILGLPKTERAEKETILIIESDEKSIGLVVDKLIGDQDIIQKKLSPPLYKVKNISGVTNLASGEVCLILDISDILYNDYSKQLPASQHAKPLPSDVLSYKRILIADNSMSTRVMIKNILLNAKYETDIATDAAEALIKLKLNHYDLIITNTEINKLEGADFIERIKNDDMYADIPIVIISSQQKEKDLLFLNKYNLDGYINKDSFNQQEFITIIHDIISRNHMK